MTEKQTTLRKDPIINDEISVKELFLKFRDWVKYLFSKWLIILIAGIIGGVSGLRYAFVNKPIYIAETTFVLEDGNGGGGMFGSLGGLAGIAGVNLNGGSGGLFQGDNIIHLYKSRRMIEKALLTPIKLFPKNELLITRYISFNELNKKSGNEHLLNTIDFTKDTLSRKRDSIISVIVKDINKNYLTVVKPDKKLSIISVTVKSVDELFAKEFTENIVETVNTFYIETKTKKALQNVLILQQKTDSVKTIMDRAIYASAATIDATPNLNQTRQVLRSPAQKLQLSVEANKVILEELVKNLELSKMALRNEIPLIQVVDVPILPLEKERIGKIRSSLFGSFLFGLVTSFLLIVRKIYNNLANE